jgi:hypothetical protein
MPTREEMRGLGEEIVRSYEDRVSGIAELRNTVELELKEFQNSRIAMGRELRADLARSVADIKTAVGTQLKELDDAHATMSKELKADLAKVRPALMEEDRKRQSEAREFMGELGRVVAQGKAAVNAQLKEFADIQAGARDEWQKLTATMQAKRAGAAVAVAPSPSVEGELLNRVFAYLANHPDGTRMTELEQVFGVPRIQMARVLKSLMDQNKVQKRGLLYFAI